MKMFDEKFKLTHVWVYKVFPKIFSGLSAMENRIAGLPQANCSYSEIYKTLKAEEIPISLSAIKRIGQHFETTGNVARKKGSGGPKAALCRDDHLLKCTVLKDRKRSQQKLSAEFKTSRRAITRRLSTADNVWKPIAVSEKHQAKLRFWQNIEI